MTRKDKIKYWRKIWYQQEYEWARSEGRSKREARAWAKHAVKRLSP